MHQFAPIRRTIGGGEEPTLVIDTQGKLHGAFSRSGNGQELVYFTRSPYGWVTQVVLTNGFFGTHRPAIAVNSLNQPRMSFVTEPSYLGYAYHDGTTWQVELVDTNTGVIGVLNSDLAIDKNDFAHIAYYMEYSAAETKQIRYATNQGGSWVTQTIDSQIVCSTRKVGIAVDTQGIVHIAYICGNRLYYVTNQSGSFVRQEILAMPGFGQYADIALDPGGQVHIAFTYYDGVVHELRHAYPTSSGWTIETVDANGDVGTFPSIAIDAAGDIHIAYYAISDDALRYARKVKNRWTVVTLDTGDVGTNSSLALDPNGAPHIVYFDNFRLGIYYATGFSLREEATSVKQVSSF